MDEAMIAQVRRFNRVVTQQVGALTDRFLARDRPLGESRLLWEIGDGRDVRSLRTALDLDSGYVSRLLRSLESAGLVTTAHGPHRLSDDTWRGVVGPQWWFGLFLRQEAGGSLL